MMTDGFSLIWILILNLSVLHTCIRISYTFEIVLDCQISDYTYIKKSVYKTLLKIDYVKI